MFGRAWLRRQKKIAASLKDTLAHRLLGERLFDRTLWIPRRQTVANGLALGLFVAFTPTIPLQMLLCALGAFLLRVNLPVAVAGVWVTNPLTALPIYLSANRLGKYILADTWLLELLQGLFVPTGRSAAFFTHAIYLWTGSVVMGGLAALVGWLAVHLLWRAVERIPR